MIAKGEEAAGDTSDLGGATSNGWPRLFLPSVRDLVFLLLFWALLMGPLASRPLADADIGWHIRAGELILATHSAPRTDPLSSTMQGQPWIAWEWLYDALLGITHRVAGLNGIVWLAALLISATFAILLAQLLRQGTGLPLALPLWLLTLGASSIHLFARPHIVSWLLTLLWFVALERWEQGNPPPTPSSKERVPGTSAPRWLRWFFPASMLLWVNLHGGWLFGIALLALYTVAASGESLRGADAIARIRAAHRARALRLAFVLSALATVVNPYGLRLHAHIYRYLSDRYLVNHIEEFRSPDFHGWAQRSFALILVLVLIAFAGNRGKIPLRHWLVVLLAGYAGLYASRNLPVSAMLLVLVVGPMLWESVASLAERPGAWGLVRSVSARMVAFAARASAQQTQLRRPVWPVLAVVSILAICIHGGMLGSRQVVQARFDSRRLPVAAAKYLDQEGAGPMFAPDAWGGYLIYRLYPQRQVVIDDRHDLYGSGRFSEYLVLMQGEPGWKEVVDKWEIRTALLPVGSTLANLLREFPEEWQPVYKDNVAVVFEKKRSTQ
jgi:hypothetical protein